MAEARPEQWQQRKESGNDPSHGGQATTRRSETTRKHQTAIAAWQPGDQPTDPDYYRTKVFPDLQGATSSAIAEALGVTTVYARQIRNGRKPRTHDTGQHWHS